MFLVIFFFVNVNNSDQGLVEMDRRPIIPLEFTSPLLHELIAACWHRDPLKRVPFNEVVFRLHRLRAIAGDGWDPSITTDETDSWFGSPYMSPRSTFSRPLCECHLWSYYQAEVCLKTAPTPMPRSDSGEFCDFVALPSPEEVDALRLEDNIVPGNNNNNRKSWKMPEPVHYTPDMKVMHARSDSRSMYTNTTVTNSEDDLSRSMVDSVTEGQSPPVMVMRTTTNGTINDVLVPSTSVTDAKDERRYRYLLEHEFNSSCELFISFIRTSANWVK